MGPTMDLPPAYMLLALLSCIAVFLGCVTAHPGRQVVAGRSPCAIPAIRETLRRAAHRPGEDAQSRPSSTMCAEAWPARGRPSLARDHLPRCGRSRGVGRPRAAAASHRWTECSPVRDTRIISARPDPLSA